jgi:hypothetical protein
MTIPTPNLSHAVTAPQREFCKAEGISLSLLTALFAQGEVDSVVIGGRFRYVILASWAAYVRRRQLGLDRDPAERAAAAARYRDSVQPYSTDAARRALAGKPKPGRPPGSGTRHRKPRHPRRASAQTALAAWKASPPTAAAPKSKPTNHRGARAEVSMSL